MSMRGFRFRVWHRASDYRRRFGLLRTRDRVGVRCSWRSGIVRRIVRLSRASVVILERAIELEVQSQASIITLAKVGLRMGRKCVMLDRPKELQGIKVTHPSLN